MQDHLGRGGSHMTQACSYHTSDPQCLADTHTDQTLDHMNWSESLPLNSDMLKQRKSRVTADNPFLGNVSTVIRVMWRTCAAGKRVGSGCTLVTFGATVVGSANTLTRHTTAGVQRCARVTSAIWETGWKEIIETDSVFV